MRVLIVEDEFYSRKVLETFMQRYGDCDVVEDGDEAVEFFRGSLVERAPYDLVLLDIMMPKLDGQRTLERMRELEQQHDKGGMGTKVIMVTALDDPQNIVKAFYQGGADSYLVKPIEKEKLEQELKNLGLLNHAPNKNHH